MDAGCYAVHLLRHLAEPVGIQQCGWGRDPGRRGHRWADRQ